MKGNVPLHIADLHTRTSEGDAMMGRGILPTSTFDSSSADEGDPNLTIRKSHSESDDDENDENNMECDDVTPQVEQSDEEIGKFTRNSNNESKTLSPRNNEEVSLFKTWNDFASHVYYISVFGMLGTVVRTFAGRLFGLDCLLKENNLLDYEDILTPVSTLLCITSDGILQRGGAIFIDLPANILGCFMMGLICPANDEHPLPWFRSQHPLQRNRALVAGLQVGFCGCLTTFSSWNIQMVMMMDGTESQLGSQVGAALFGYLVGTACAVSSFIFGRHVAEWMRCHHARPHLSTSETGGLNTDHSVDSEDMFHRRNVLQAVLVKLIGVNSWPIIAVIGIFVAATYGDISNDNVFCRTLWLSILLTPFGAILRWRLFELNFPKLRRTRGGEWFPWGTFFANVLASFICATIKAIHSRYLGPDDESFDWVSPVMLAINTGFAGSLSTVSKLVREMFVLETPGQANCYCFITIVCSMIVSLIIYSPIIRTG